MKGKRKTAARAKPPTESNPPHRPIELPGAWGNLARAAGTVNDLAVKLGVSPRTIQRWARKTVPMNYAAQFLVASTARFYGVESPCEV